jgi:cyclic-di-GMP-binding protein
MPSFDIQSKVDVQVLDNAINTVNRELGTRYDFKGTHYLVELDKKAMTLKIEVESDMKLDQLIDVLVSRSMRQGVDANAYDLSKEHYPSGKIIKKDVNVKSGLAQEDAKKIVKVIKDSGLKVQAAIMGDVVRVTGKKIDDLQDVIALCRTKQDELKLPLQFDNMKN